MSVLVGRTPCIIAVRHHSAVGQQIGYIGLGILCAIVCCRLISCRKRDCTLLVIKTRGGVFFNTQKLLLPHRHIVPPSDGISDCVFAAVVGNHIFTVHEEQMVVALYHHETVCGKVTCDINPIGIGVTALIPITVYNAALDMDGNRSEIGEHLIAACIGCVEDEEALRVARHWYYVHTLLELCSGARGRISGDSINLQCSTIGDICSNEYINHIAGVCIYTGGVIEPRIFSDIYFCSPVVGVAIGFVCMHTKFLFASSPRIVLYLFCCCNKGAVTVAHGCFELGIAHRGVFALERGAKLVLEQLCVGRNNLVFIYNNIVEFVVFCTYLGYFLFGQFNLFEYPFRTAGGSLGTGVPGYNVVGSVAVHTEIATVGVYDIVFSRYFAVLGYI